MRCGAVLVGTVGFVDRRHGVEEFLRNRRCRRPATSSGSARCARTRTVARSGFRNRMDLGEGNER
jgi:hypothetical protein